MVINIPLIATTRKPIFEAIVNSEKVTALFDTGSDKVIWYGNENELKHYGGKFKNNNGAFKGIGGSIQVNKPVYTVNIKVYSQGRGISFQNVDVIINDNIIRAGAFKIILPYTLLSGFRFSYEPKLNKPGDYGRLKFLVPDNKVIYRAVQSKDFAIDEVYAIE